MRRREFITLLGGATAWPLAAYAQQSKLPVVGYLHTAASEPYALMMSAFRDGLKEAGYIAGQNVAIEARWAEGHVERLPALAAGLVRKEVKVLATGGGESSALAAKQATSTIPIVFVTGSDPVKSHLVDSLNRPGGHLTGITFFTLELGPKRLGLLRELVPSAHAVALLVDAKNAGGGDGQEEIENAARTGGPKLQVLKASNAQEIDQAFSAMVQMRPDALLIVSSPLFTNSRHQIVTLANHHRIPAIYPLREYVLAGGLLSYGASIVDAYRQSGVYTGRILQGAKASDLPIQQPTKFELLINLKAAKTSGIEIPAGLLARADEVID
jgi:putative ABC transport system substrate-binding protein